MHKCAAVISGKKHEREDIATVYLAGPTSDSSCFRGNEKGKPCKQTGNPHQRGLSAKTH